MRILHVENNQTYSQWLSEELGIIYKDSNLTLINVDTLDKACELSIIPNTYDVILLDPSLPDACDFDALKTLLRICKNIPIIVLTNVRSKDEGLAAVQHGAQDYLIKESCTAERIGKSIEYAIERKKAGQQSKNTIEHLELVIGSTAIAIWDWNITTGVSQIDERWAEISGYKLSELQPFSIDKLTAMMPADDVTMLRQRLKEHWRDNTPEYKSEYRIRHKDGQYVWVEDRGKVVEWDENANPIRMVGTHLNITERRENEDKLKKLSRIASQSTNGVVITDALGRIEWINERFSKITGYDEKDMLGKKPGDILQGAASNAEAINQMRIAILKEEEFHVEIINYHKNGTEYWIDIQSSPLKDENGNLQGFMAIQTELTSIKKINLKLEQQQQMFEQMSELGRIGAWGVDLKKGEIYWSSMTKKIHEVPQNYEPDLTTGIDFYKEGYSRDKIKTLVQHCIENGTPFNTELQIVTAKNREIWIATRGKSEQENGVITRIFGSIQEITEKKRTESALIAAKETAENASSIKSDFLATMSHEIRTPINGVIGMLNLLNHSHLPDLETHRIKVARNSAHLLLSLINDILDFSKVEAGKLNLEEIHIDLNKHFADFSQTIALRAQEKNLEFILDTQELDCQYVIADPNRLLQILNNLVSNAIKFTLQGEIFVKCKSKKLGQSVLLNIDIKDTGIGIPPDKIGIVFESFTQADTTTTREYGGTGLGLAIARKLCNLMSGDITVQSKLGQGSIFSVAITLKASEQNTIPTTLSLKGKTILLVDDNTTNCSVLASQLRVLNANVIDVYDGAQALRQCKKAIKENIIFDLAIIDMHMPSMNGVELVKRIQSFPEFQTIKTIMMTAMSSNRNNTQDFLDCNFSAHIVKPVTSKNLEDALTFVFLPAKMNAFTTKMTRPSPTIPHKVIRNTSENFNWPKNTRVLIVDDNIINLEVASGLLEDLNLTLGTAANGLEAVKELKKSTAEVPYSLVLMDCLMPIMDGYEATKRIREGDSGASMKDVTIIAMTANAMTGDREKCLNSGMDDYLAKPIDIDIMIAKMKEWIPNKSNQTLQNNQSNNNSNELNHIKKTDKPVWSFAATLKRVNNKEERVVKLINLFLTDMPKRVIDLEQSITENDFKNTIQLTHAIKGISSNFNAITLSTIASEMEISAKNEDSHVLQATYPLLCSSFDEVCHALNDYLSTYTEK